MNNRPIFRGACGFTVTISPFSQRNVAFHRAVQFLDRSVAVAASD